MARRRLVAGNWKMHGLREDLSHVGEIAGVAGHATSEVLLCLPATLLSEAVYMAQNTRLHLGGQACHYEREGPYTGAVSAAMLRDVGASHVIVGHSERRAQGLDDAGVRSRAGRAVAEGLTAIVCLGEDEAEHDAGRSHEVVLRQLTGSLPENATPAKTVIAYEPVWAIGSGRTPSEEQIGEMLAALRADLADARGKEAADEFRLLYGGSVKKENATALFSIENLDGVLVGSASLTAASFGPIIEAGG